MAEVAPEATTPAATTPESPEGSGGFDQESVNKIAGQRAKEARQAEINRLLEKSGAESVDQLLEGYITYAQAESEAQSDYEKMEAKNQALEERAAAAEQLADQRLISAELRTALMSRGVPADRVADALALTDRSSLTIENDTVTGLDEAITAMLEPRPWLTETAEPRQPRRAADVTGPRVATGEEPEAQMGSFMAQLLNGR